MYVSSYCSRQVASRSHTYYWMYISRTINRRGSARLHVKYNAHVRHLFGYTTFLPDYSRIILNSPHSLLFSNYSGIIGASLTAMALLRYLKPKSSHPAAKDTGLDETTTKEANAAVQRVLTEQPQPTGGTRTRKLYTYFSDEQRAAIGRYTTEHSNAAAVKKCLIL